VKFSNYVNLLLEALTPKKYLVLIPGGFKPPTVGHFDLIKSYSDNPQVQEVIVLIGPKERESVGREQSLAILKLYGIDKLPKVSIQKTSIDNPMQAAFDFTIKEAVNDRYAGLTVGIGASDKGGDDERSHRLVKYFEAHPEKLPANITVGIPPIVRASQFANANISATVLRNAIRTKDRTLIRELIPAGVSVDDFLAILKSKNLK
jgi:nicotinic acid mononucleotide adenylyltransferase